MTTAITALVHCCALAVLLCSLQAVAPRCDGAQHCAANKPSKGPVQQADKAKKLQAAVEKEATLREQLKEERRQLKQLKRDGGDSEALDNHRKQIKRTRTKVSYQASSVQILNNDETQIEMRRLRLERERTNRQTRKGDLITASGLGNTEATKKLDRARENDRVRKQKQSRAKTEKQEETIEEYNRLLKQPRLLFQKSFNKRKAEVGEGNEVAIKNEDRRKQQSNDRNRGKEEKQKKTQYSLPQQPLGVTDADGPTMTAHGAGTLQLQYNGRAPHSMCTTHQHGRQWTPQYDRPHYVGCASATADTIAVGTRGDVPGWQRQSGQPCTSRDYRYIFPSQPIQQTHSNTQGQQSAPARVWQQYASGFAPPNVPGAVATRGNAPEQQRQSVQPCRSIPNPHYRYSLPSQPFGHGQQSAPGSKLFFQESYGPTTAHGAGTLQLQYNEGTYHHDTPSAPIVQGTYSNTHGQPSANNNYRQQHINYKVSLPNYSSRPQLAAYTESPPIVQGTYDQTQGQQSAPVLTLQQDAPCSAPANVPGTNRDSNTSFDEELLQLAEEVMEEQLAEEVMEEQSKEELSPRRTNVPQGMNYNMPLPDYSSRPQLAAYPQRQPIAQGTYSSTQRQQYAPVLALPGSAPANVPNARRHVSEQQNNEEWKKYINYSASPYTGS